MKLVFSLIVVAAVSVSACLWMRMPTAGQIEVVAIPKRPLIADSIQPFSLTVSNQNYVDVQVLNLTHC